MGRVLIEINEMANVIMESGVSYSLGGLGFEGGKRVGKTQMVMNDKAIEIEAESLLGQ